MIASVLMASESDLLPDPIERCLEMPNVGARSEVSKTVNPFYLRGDFDGDGKSDYAVAVKGKVSGRLRVLMCMGSNSAIFLGSENGDNPFSDMKDDNFFAPNWMVYTVSEAKRIGRYKSNEPRRLATIRGEVLVMWWEDGMSAIYWDGSAFKWAPAQR
jgi:hypothetical protein